MSFCPTSSSSTSNLNSSIKLNSIYDSYNQLNNKLTHEKEVISHNFISWKEVQLSFSSGYNSIITDLTAVIDSISSLNTSKKDETIDNTEVEVSPAGKPSRKPNLFERLDKLNGYVNIEDDGRMISNVTSGWCTVKIRGSLEEGLSDSCEVMIHNQGDGGDGSGFMFGVIEAEPDFPLTYYPGEKFFSFARHGTIYQTNNAIEGDIGSHNCGSWGTGSRLKMSLDPQSGDFTLEVDGESRLNLRLIITNPVCFCIGMYYNNQKVEIIS